MYLLRMFSFQNTFNMCQWKHPSRYITHNFINLFVSFKIFRYKFVSTNQNWKFKVIWQMEFDLIHNMVIWCKISFKIVFKKLESVEIFRRKISISYPSLFRGGGTSVSLRGEGNGYCNLVYLNGKLYSTTFSPREI